MARLVRQTVASGSRYLARSTASNVSGNSSASSAGAPSSRPPPTAPPPARPLQAARPDGTSSRPARSDLFQGRSSETSSSLEAASGSSFARTRGLLLEHPSASTLCHSSLTPSRPDHDTRTPFSPLSGRSPLPLLSALSFSASPTRPGHRSSLVFHDRPPPCPLSTPPTATSSRPFSSTPSFGLSPTNSLLKKKSKKAAAALEQGVQPNSSSSAQTPPSTHANSKKRAKKPKSTKDLLAGPGRKSTAAPFLGPVNIKVDLSPEQRKVHDMVVKQGTSLFYTGSAGTGKSILLRAIIASLRTKYQPDEVAVTASTGIAGNNIGGQTLHSFAGIGSGERTVESLMEFISKDEDKLDRWLNTKVWIIDEISMVDARLFEKLATIGSFLRKDDRPFGGIQMVLCGDFFQLPPVVKRGQPTSFAFDAPSWPHVVERQLNLTTVFRQSDPNFIRMLDEMRYGTVSPSTTVAFRQRSKEIVYPDGVKPTELYPLRALVEESNLSRMAALPSEAKTFYASDEGYWTGQDFDASLRLHLIKQLIAPASIDLKVGAQVMLICNLPDIGLFNGSVGIVESFEGGYPQVAFTRSDGKRIEHLAIPHQFTVESYGGKQVGWRKAVPLILAWALSIHKSQGQTLQRVKVDLATVFESGQAYVALSRATSLDGLQIIGFDPIKVRSHPRVKEWYATELEVVR